MGESIRLVDPCGLWQRFRTGAPTNRRCAGAAYRPRSAVRATLMSSPLPGLPQYHLVPGDELPERDHTRSVEDDEVVGHEQLGRDGRRSPEKMTQRRER